MQERTRRRLEKIAEQLRWLETSINRERRALGMAPIKLNARGPGEKNAA